MSEQDVIPCCIHCVHGPGFVHELPCLNPAEHDDLVLVERLEDLQ